MQRNAFIIRVATLWDLCAIRAMHARSIRQLGPPFYEPSVIEQLLIEVGTLDTAIVTEGHYFVIEDVEGHIVGSGGWSRFTPTYDLLQSHDTTGLGAANVRGVFVEPNHTRKGLATRIMQRIETDAWACGIQVLHLTATLSGVALYQAFDYQPIGPKILTLSNGSTFECLDMEKTLSAQKIAA